MSYSVSDVAALSGLSVQVVIHLIERHKLLVPTKEKWGNREVMAFSDEDLKMFKIYVKLIRLGYKNSQAVEKTRHIETYKSVAQEFFHALATQDRVKILESLQSLPSVERVKLDLLTEIDGRNVSLVDVASRYGYGFEKDVVEDLRDIRTVIGREFFFLLQLATDPEW